MPVLIAYVGDRQNGLRTERVLNTSAVLSAGCRLVVIDSQASNVRRLNGLERGRRSGRKQDVWILELHAGQANVQTEGDVWTGIVHVVALNALVHDGESAPNDRLAATGQVISKAKMRTEGRPVVVHQALGYAVLPGSPNAVQVQGNARQDRVRAGAESGTCHAGAVSVWISRAADVPLTVKCGSLGWIIKIRIEVPHAIVGFVRVRHSIPAQAEVQGQLVRRAPVVLNISTPGMVRPHTMVLDGKLLITGGGAKQEISEAISRVALIISLEGECALGRSEKVLNLLVEGPAPAEFELVRAFRPGDVIANLVVVGLVDPRPARDLEIRIALFVERNVGHAIQVVRSGEQAGVGEVAWYGACRASGKRQAGHTGGGIGSDIDPVAVIVKRHFVDEGWANGVGSVNDGAVGWIVKRISNRGQVITAPLGRVVALGDLLGNEVTEYGKFI